MLFCGRLHPKKSNYLQVCKKIILSYVYQRYSALRQCNKDYLLELDSFHFTLRYTKVEKDATCCSTGRTWSKSLKNIHMFFTHWQLNLYQNIRTVFLSFLGVIDEGAGLISLRPLFINKIVIYLKKKFCSNWLASSLG